MSLSDDDNKDEGASQWGTIFSQGREHSLGGIEHSRSTAWSAEDEAAYLERVRAKAVQMAEGIITEAKEEAERLKQAAHEEGYAQGLSVAQEELDTFRSGMADSVSAVLNAIEGQCSQIFDQWRDDLIGVTRLAVEAVTGMELSTERSGILEALLVKAVAVLEKRRELVIRVNPEDEPMISDIIGLTKSKFPDVQTWRVRADAGISPGGMVVESESSLAEGRLESRRAAVDEILSNLTLPTPL